MRVLTLDVEAKVTWKEDGTVDGSPFNPDNYLVSVGYSWRNDDQEPINKYLFFRHNEFNNEEQLSNNCTDLQLALDSADLVVGHNVKYDMMWLYECGFTYDGALYDTMIGEYVLMRGLKGPLSLKELAIRRGLANKKSDLVDGYWKKKIGYEAMPIGVVEEYGRGDIQTTVELYYSQLEDYAKSPGLVKTRDMMNEFCKVLIDMERAGIKIDKDSLLQLKDEYQKELVELEVLVKQLAWEVMGDKPYNLASPEQLSQVIYGVSVDDKKEWADIFNIGTEFKGATKKPKRRPNFKEGQFRAYVKALTKPVSKTRAETCTTCGGTGFVQKVKVDGTNFKNLSRCHTCDGAKFVYHDVGVRAGFGCIPISIEDVSASGFSTGSDTLQELARRTRDEKAKKFLLANVRKNAIETYISTFIGGIERHVRVDGILHPTFNQCVTATGRLSHSNPNFGNLPRGNTFPVKRALISRWADIGGSITGGDFAQLEFRTAVFLAQDKQGMKDIDTGHDVHKYTASILCHKEMHEVTSDERQDAKPDTFKPLYGGVTGTTDQEAYYKSFLIRYPEIDFWQDDLQSEAIRTKKIVLPTGREYAFPNAKRNYFGNATGATQIKNYPVQGFATGDIVPLACISVWKALRDAGARSLIINEVHDSIDIDTYPGEEELVKHILVRCMLGVIGRLNDFYGIVFNVPLDVEVKNGPNCLIMKKIYPDKK